MSVTFQPRSPDPRASAGQFASSRSSTNASRRSAIPRRSWFTLQTTQPSYEEACRRTHRFAASYPLLYRLRMRLLFLFACGVQVTAPLLLAGMALYFPWAFRHTTFLAPIYAEPALRWTLLALFYWAWLPPAALYCAAAFRALTLRTLEPPGIPLSPADAPRLFRLLADVSRSLDVESPPRVLVSPDRVLEVRRLPARGLFGSARPLLVLGLPLLEELSPQYFRAQLAHELAHLGTLNRRFGGAVLGLRERLSSVLCAAESSALSRTFWAAKADEALAGILDCLLLRLGPETLPAARQHESEADAIAAAIAGREFAAAALVRRRLAAHALSQQFRAECLLEAERIPAPPGDLFERRAEAARGAFRESQVHAWLRLELESKDDLTDSHPPLWDRLRLFGYQLETLDDFQSFLDATQPHSALGETAARFFLGDAADAIRAHFFSDWSERQATDWRVRFETYQQLRDTAAEWPAASRKPACSPHALWQIAVAIGNTQSWRAARPVAQRILQLDGAHGDANLLEGQFRLEEGDRTGLDALELAMAADPRSIIPSCHLAARFLEARGETEAAAAYKRRADERRQSEQKMAEERRHVRATDSYVAADPAGETVATLLRAVQQHASHIRSAYLLKKLLPGEGQKPLYVLGVERKNLRGLNSHRANRLLLRRISEVPGLPGDILICVITRGNRDLLSKWKSIPGGLFWSPAFERATGHPPTRPVAAPARVFPLLREPPATSAFAIRHDPAPAK